LININYVGCLQIYREALIFNKSICYWQHWLTFSQYQ